MSRLTVKINYNPGYDNFDLYLRLREFEGRIYTLKPLEIIEVPAYSPLPPFLTPDKQIIPKEFCQAILDAAWNEGMRPTGFKDVLNETAAIRYHLEDMRTLVFKKK